MFRSMTCRKCQLCCRPQIGLKRLRGGFPPPLRLIREIHEGLVRGMWKSRSAGRVGQESEVDWRITDANSLRGTGKRAVTVHEYVVVVVVCFVVRVSEIADFQWSYLDTAKRQLLVEGNVVSGRVDDLKIEYSRDHVPIHESLLQILLPWSEQCP